MKSCLTLLLALALTGSVLAQDDAMAENYKKKMKKDFVSKIPWETSFEAARKKAKEQNKVIYGYFSRSYAP